MMPRLFDQLYDSHGVYQNEYQLPDLIFIDANIKYHYRRETGYLYFLNTIDQEHKEIGFEILKYKIRE